MQTASSTPQANTLRIGRIAKVYSEKHVVDVVFLDDGGFASGVGVSSQWGSQGHGFHYLPDVKDPPDGQWSVELSNKNDTLALIGYFSGQPFVVGTLYPAATNGDMYGLAANELMIQQVLGPHLYMDKDASVTLRSLLTAGNGSLESKLILDKGLVILLNNLCSLTMKKDGLVQVQSGGGNKIKMDPSGAIEITSGGGAVIKMGAGGVIEFNPVDPNAPV